VWFEGQNTLGDIVQVEGTDIRADGIRGRALSAVGVAL
jgi:hypothetical protein